MTLFIKPVVLLLATVLLYGQTAKADCRQVSASGEALITGGISAEEARTSALTQARQQALIRLGIEIKTITTDQISGDHNLFYQISRQMSGGLFLRQKLVWQTIQQPAKADQPPLLGYRVSMDACVQLRLKNPALQVNVTLRGNDTAIFADGDIMAMAITCSFDCYLTIFNLLQDGKAVLQVPSRAVALPKLLPGTPWVFPPDDIVLRLSTGSPTSKKVTEAYMIVAASRPMRPAATTLTFAQLQEWLATLPADQWTDATLPYSVIRK